MTVRQDSQASNKNRLPLQNKVLGNNRSVSTIRRREKKKHRNLKQIFVLSLDALRERKGRSALTMLMVVVGGALMVAINGMSAGSAVFMNKQLVSLAPNVIFVSPGSKSKTFQEAPGLATQAPRLPFNAEVANMIKSLPYVKDVVPGYTQTDCRTYSANGKLNHANRYDIGTAISTTSVKNIISPLFPSLYILTLQPAYGLCQT